MPSSEAATRRAVSMPDEEQFSQVDQIPPTSPPDPQPVSQPEPTQPVVPEPASPTPPTPQQEEEPKKLGPDDVLWPGGPTMAMIDKWKDQYGAGNIYVTAVTPDVNVVWRTLTRFEYRRLVKNMEQAVNTGQVSSGEANLNNEEQTLEICTLYPQFTRQQMAGELAGLPSLIAQEVMQASGFEALEVRQL